MLGIEPRTSYMQSMRSTTELHPHDIRLHTRFLKILPNSTQIAEKILWMDNLPLGAEAQTHSTLTALCVTWWSGFTWTHQGSILCVESQSHEFKPVLS